MSLKKLDVKDNEGYGCREPLSTAGAALQGIPCACWYILVVELCERLAFYTFNGTIAFFLERIGFSLVSAGGYSSCMITLCFIWTLLASWFADVVCGRYRTILISAVVYVFGCLVAALATWPGAENVGIYFVGMLILIPIATAGIKANLSNLGADQYDMSQPGAEAAQERFFSIFYLFINIGSLVAYGFMTTFASNGGLGVPQAYGYFAAYLAASFFMLLATVLYIWGSDRYHKVPTQESSAIFSVASSLVALSQGGLKQATAICVGVLLLLAGVFVSLVQAFIAPGAVTHALVLCGFACAALGLIAIIVPCSNTDWLATGASSLRPNHEDVKGFLDLLPTLFLGNLAFSALYNCMAFWYQQQACQMDLRFTPAIQLSGSFFNVADCLAIVLVTPLAVYYLNPLYEERANIKMSYGTKFGVGMAFGVLSVVSAISMELSRRDVAVLDVLSQCAPPGVHMSAFPAVWMLAPYFLMGIGEIYCNPTLMHYAYSRSPPSMRTLAAAVSFFIQAIASSLFTLLLDVARPFVTDNLNDGHLEYGYLLSICIALVFYVFFVRVLT